MNVISKVSCGILLTILLLSTTVGAVKTSKNMCVYPIPDGGGVTPSKASFEGKILKVQPQSIMVQPLHSHTGKLVRIDKKTDIFTQFGGVVLAGGLKTGDQVSVWLKNCNIPSTSLAAVIEVER